jgi:hypothetical protein
MALELRTKLLTRAEDHAWREQQQTQTPLERAREREALLVNPRLNIPEVLNQINRLQPFTTSVSWTPFSTIPSPSAVFNTCGQFSISMVL